MKKSIEAEYWVIDENGELTRPGALTETSENVEAEFVEPLFELKTPPCETIADLREALVSELSETLSQAEELGKQLVPLGTPIHSPSIERWASKRGRIQREVIGTEFDYANYCAGTHLHFEQRNVTDQLNTLIAVDPALALANSSPYFQGERIASSARAYCYRKKCYENWPKHGQLWEYVHTVAEWEERLDHRFEEFKTAAIEAGIDGESVDENFSPDNVVWTPVRLREEMPTVEWRSPDVTLPSQTLMLATEIDALMERLHHTSVTVEGQSGAVTDDGITLPEFDTVCDRVDEAINDGLSSDDLTAYLERMGFDVSSYDPLTQTFDGKGSVSLDEARDLRLDYADRLEADVAQLRRTEADGSLA